MEIAEVVVGRIFLIEISIFNNNSSNNNSVVDLLLLLKF